jgi:ABC-type antimicrobial peptide transport system permease subunit
VKEYVDREKQRSDVESRTKVVYTAAVMLIVMGAILAFVVLYNSSILNFSERIRDLATFRVLGFYHKEIRALVLMENILCAILGSIFGIPVGKAIAFVVASGLDDQMDLISRINLETVVLAGATTLVFTLIINKVVAKKMRTGFLWLLASILLGACGQLLLKSGVNRLGQINLTQKEILNTIFHIFTNPWVITGIICFVTSMILWIKVISNMELSRAYPSVGLSYLIVFIFSITWFHEAVTAEKVVGMILVCCGVYFLNV